MRIAFSQINPIVGDIAGNAEIILDQIKEADEKNCAIIIFPELALTGYPPEDLIFKPAFIKDNITALNDLSRLVRKTVALVGFIDKKNDQLFNSLAWVENGKVRTVYHKRELPNYGVFDEERYFKAGPKPLVKIFKNLRIGLTICEDLWATPRELGPLSKLKPDLVINSSASPFQTGKLSLRQQVLRRSARTLAAPVLYCNLVGGQDELIFDGGSFLLKSSGEIMARCPQFKTGLFHLDLNLKNGKFQVKPNWEKIPELPENEQILEALLLGIRDYVRKNGFEKVTVAISGGIDSALVAALAVLAMGPDRVISVTLPSRFNKAETISDAKKLASNLGTKLIELPIEPVFKEFLGALSPTFGQTPPNIAEENLQARIRGTIMMSLSNKFGWLVLTTGNKSEVSTGYCTLYGDTAGGFAVLKDVLKTTVYKLARLINEKAGKEIIPETTIKRPPTAELRENQKDEDSLGRYADLDPVIVGYVEENKTIAEIQKTTGQKEDYIRKVVSLINKNEYKRRQAPPGIKITPRSFGRDHRMPITNRYTPSI